MQYSCHTEIQQKCEPAEIASSGISTKSQKQKMVGRPICIIRHSHNSKTGSQHNYWASPHKPNENGSKHNFLVGGIPQCLYEIQWEPTRFASSSTKNVFPRVVCCSGMQEVRGAIFILLGRWITIIYILNKQFHWREKFY